MVLGRNWQILLHNYELDATIKFLLGQMKEFVNFGPIQAQNVTNYGPTKLWII